MKQIKLRYEPEDTPAPDCVGTIRSVPENYYVASVRYKPTNTAGNRYILLFEDIEACTRNLKYKIAAVKFWDNIQGKDDQEANQ